MFTIPSIGLTGTLLDCNISSAKVVYHNMQISDKMGKNVAKKEVTELISPNTEVIRSGETNDKLRKRFKIKETKLIKQEDPYLKEWKIIFTALIKFQTMVS